MNRSRIRGNTIKKLIVLIFLAAFIIGLMQGCATTKGALAGAAIGGLAGDAGKGAQIGATAGFVVDLFD